MEFMEGTNTPLLDKINFPKDLRKLPKNNLEDLAVELRNETVNAVSVTGGHLGASLGVIELTIAIHYVFNTPNDRLVWDVGHQAYPHKILTGRRDKIKTLRQKMVFMDLQKERKANMIHLALPMLQQQCLLV